MERRLIGRNVFLETDGKDETVIRPCLADGCGYVVKVRIQNGNRMAAELAANYAAAQHIVDTMHSHPTLGIKQRPPKDQKMGGSVISHSI